MRREHPSQQGYAPFIPQFLHGRCKDDVVSPATARFFKTLETGKELAENDLTAVFSGIDFGMKADRLCERSSNVIGNSPMCTSKGSDGEFAYLFTLWSPSPGELQLVVLNVEPENVPD